MSIPPEGELLRRAIKWISEQRKCAPEKRFSDLLNEACMKFDLSPKEADTVMKYTKEDQTSGK